MSIIGSNILAGASGQATGYNLNNSLRFRKSASAFLNRTLGTASNRKTWTWSAWVKRGTLSDSEQALFHATSGNPTGGLDYGTGIRFAAGDQLLFYSFINTSFEFSIATAQVFRDPSAWYHIVVAVDTTQATSSNRIKLYINGSQVTALGTASYPTLNYDTYINSANGHFIGKTVTDASSIDFFDGYTAEVNFIDGQALTPSSFGETDTTTGVWKPKAYTSTYGTNGFYLKFSDIATTSGSNAGLGKDFSGNANYWTTNNISVTAGTTYDAMIDVPTLTSATVANYATLNPLDGVLTLSSANLNATYSTDGITRATIWMTSGKWYWEAIPLSFNTVQSYPRCGVSNALLATSANFGDTANGWSLLITDSGSFGGKGFNNGAITGTATPFALSDIAMFAYDADSGKLWFGKNGTWLGSGDPANGTNAFFTGVTAPVSPTVGANTASIAINFGQRPFSYTPPTGFVRLNTFNLPDSTIKKGNTVMDATTYTGTGSALTITNAGSFKTDLVWVKSRSNGATWHILADSVRGAGYQLSSNQTNAEIYDAQGVGFASNGFTLGADTVDAYYGWNLNGDTYVGWQWQAGQGTTSSNTSGSITSTVSVNATAGFSVVTWTGNSTSGATIGHGLGVAPKMVIVKGRSNAYSWIVYHASNGNTGAQFLNSTDAFTVNSVYWNNTSPSSSVVTLGNTVSVNQSGNTFVAYCWSEISGYSKAFSYTGNGSTDGSFVYTGFLPRFVMIKRTDTTGDWYMWDTARNTFDVITNTLLANSSAAETSATSIDALSNGFKLRNTTAGFNASGGTYIGMAWASSPFKNSNAF